MELDSQAMRLLDAGHLEQFIAIFLYEQYLLAKLKTQQSAKCFEPAICRFVSFEPNLRMLSNVSV